LAVRPEIVAKTVPDSRVARIARSTILYVLLGALGIAAARSSAAQDNLRRSQPRRIRIALASPVSRPTRSSRN